MNQPYRENAMPTKCHKLARKRAFLRGLWRRIVVPTIVMCISFMIAQLIIWGSYSDTKTRIENAQAWHDANFAQQQKVIDANQAKMNVRQFELDEREREFNARLKHFEDIMLVMPMLTKNASDQAQIMNALLKEARHTNNRIER